MKKADEMENYITIKSLRMAYIFTVIVLIIWVVYDYISIKQLNLPFYLLVTQNVIFFTTQLIYRKKMEGKNEEQN